MNLKNIALILIFLVITNCGYKTIYSGKNEMKYSFEEYELVGENLINKKIVKLIKSTDTGDSINLYNLKIISDKKIEIIAKDKAGNASIFRTTINVDLILEDNKKNVIEKTFNKKFSYKNFLNKFDLSLYQKNVEKNLINKISEEILLFLTS